MLPSSQIQQEISLRGLNKSGQGSKPRANPFQTWVNSFTTVIGCLFCWMALRSRDLSSLEQALRALTKRHLANLLEIGDRETQSDGSNLGMRTLASFKFLPLRITERIILFPFALKTIPLSLIMIKRQITSFNLSGTGWVLVTLIPSFLI